jgi:hypothetical protein
MDAATIEEIITVVASVIKTAVDLGPTIIKAAKDAEPFAANIVNTIIGKETTKDELAQLEAAIADLSAQLQATLPEQQADDI